MNGFLQSRRPFQAWRAGLAAAERSIYGWSPDSLILTAAKFGGSVPSTREGRRGASAPGVVLDRQLRRTFHQRTVPGKQRARVTITALWADEPVRKSPIEAAMAVRVEDGGLPNAAIAPPNRCAMFSSQTQPIA
jgi:hypothetical protein